MRAHKQVAHIMVFSANLQYLTTGALLGSSTRSSPDQVRSGLPHLEDLT